MKIFEYNDAKLYKYAVQVPPTSGLYAERFAGYYTWCAEQFGEADMYIWTWNVDPGNHNTRIFRFTNEEHRTFFILRFSK